MRVVTQIVGVACVAAAAAAAAEGLNSPRSAERELAALRNQVKELQLRVSALEAKAEQVNLPRMHRAAP